MKGASPGDVGRVLNEALHCLRSRMEDGSGVPGRRKSPALSTIPPGVRGLGRADASLDFKSAKLNASSSLSDVLNAMEGPGPVESAIPSARPASIPDAVSGAS